MARHSRVEVGHGVLARASVTVLIASALIPACGGDDDGAAGGATSATATSPASTSAASTPDDTSPSTPRPAGLDTFPPVDTEPPDEGSGSAGLGLPDGPNSPGENRDRDVYDALREGRCESAADSLDRHWDKVRSPRDVLIYEAAVELCRGDAANAARWLAAASGMGLEGLAVPVETRDGEERVQFAYYCEVFRSVRAVLEESARDGVECPGGVPPAWPGGDDEERDDPRTPEDESSMTAARDDTSAPTSTPPTSAVPPSLSPEATMSDTATTSG